MPNLEIIAKEADIIVNGYAFLVKEDKISAFDLNNGIGAAVFTKEGILIVEAMHVHASDSKLTENGSAKFFVKGNGDSILQSRGILTDKELSKIQAFIKINYQEMYNKWAKYSSQSFYNKTK